MGALRRAALALAALLGERAPGARGAPSGTGAPGDAGQGAGELPGCSGRGPAVLAGAAGHARQRGGHGAGRGGTRVRPAGRGNSGMNRAGRARAFRRASGRSRRYRGVTGQGAGAAGGTRDPGTAGQELGRFRVAPGRTSLNPWTMGYQGRESQHPPVSVPPVPYPSRQVVGERGERSTPLPF